MASRRWVILANPRAYASLDRSLPFGTQTLKRKTTLFLSFLLLFFPFPLFLFPGPAAMAGALERQEEHVDEDGE